MMKVDLFGKNGKKKGETELPAALAEVKVNPSLVHQAIVRELANARRGTAATKTRGMVSGGGIKPWRQKGTGRARAGSSRSPLWVGGGKTFGPQPRSYEQKMNRKMRQAALKSVIVDKANSGFLKVIESVELAAPKTKEFLKIMKDMSVSGSVLVVVAAENKNLELASRNVKDVKFVLLSELNTFDILKYQDLVVTADVLALFGGNENVQSA